MRSTVPEFADAALGSQVRAIAAAVQQAGGRAFLVGGSVRDGVLGLPPKDADLEVYGLAPDAVESLIAGFGRVHLVGRRFAVLHLATDAGQIEVSLPRRESKTGPGHKGFAVSADPRMSPKEAARRRDFTVNALLQDAISGEILDPWHGLDDLERGLLRHVSPSFAEDPLRVMRAGRFVARFGWRVHPETVTLCRGLDLSELPRERLELEWRQVLVHGDHPGAGLLALENVGALRFFPEIAALRGVPQDPVWHPEGDVFHHTCLALDAGASLRHEMEDPWVEMLAILCHDLGKASHTVLERGRWRSANHDVAGVEPTRRFLQRITASQDVIEPVVALVREHLRPMQLFQAREHVGDGAVRRLLLRVPLPALLRVAWADGAGRHAPRIRAWPPALWLEERVAQLGLSDDRPRPFLQGRDLLALGMEPGPAVGAVLSEAFELQLDGRLADREAALRWAEERVAAEP